MQHKNRPHIAFFTSNLRGGGAQKMMLHLAQGFAERGFKTDLVLLNARGQLRQHVPHAVRLVNLRSNALTGVFALARYIGRERPDAILSTITGPNIMALLARKLLGARTRVIIRQENLFGRKPWPRGAIAAALARRLYSKADGIIAISKHVARELEERIGVPQGRINVLYNPVIMKKPEHRDCPHPWLARGQPPVIISAGYFSPQKDFPTLIRAFARVRRQRHARLIILGEGPLRKKLERLAASLGIGKDVLLPCYAADAAPWFARASVFALSSAWEGFGNVLVEALACGTPVVSTDCGPSQEVLDGGKCGKLVPVGDDRALAEGILGVLDKPQSPEILKQRAQSFSAEQRIPPYVYLVRQALRNI